MTDVLAGVLIKTDTVSRTRLWRPRQRSPAPDGVMGWGGQQQRTPRRVIVSTMTVSAFRIVKDRYEPPISSKGGIIKKPERKNPGWCVPNAPTGVLVDPREVPGGSGNLPELFCGGYVIPIPIRLAGR